MTTKTGATIEDLYRTEAKAEFVNGEIAVMSPTGGKSGRASGKIYISLDTYEREHGGGYAFGDNIGFLVNLPHRKSFSPDAAFYKGGTIGEDFLEGAPVFAAEVRSKNDYGEQAEKQIADKRRDYFAAGTQVVWDVDVLRDEVVRVYQASDADNPKIYRHGEIAEAEPALPGWRMPVDELFA